MKESIQNRENTPSQISEALHDLVGAQRQELESLEAQIPNLDSINLFEWYKKHERFSRTYHEAMGYALMPTLNLVGSRNLENNFAGVAFENIAFTVCALKENSNGIIVLSPTRTKELFKSLYPNAPRVDFPFREDSLGGNISIPDGIGIDESGLQDNAILNIYEYSLSERKKVFRIKYDLFREKKRNFPELFSNASLVFVVPKIVSMPEITANDIRYIETPFSRSRFRKFMDDVYRTYTIDEGIPPLEKIEGWGKMPHSGDLQMSQVDRAMKSFFAGMK